MNEIEFSTSDEYFEIPFYLAIYNDQKDIELQTNKFYQFHFKNRNIKLTGYMFNMNYEQESEEEDISPIKFILSTSLNGNDWREIDSQENFEQLFQEENLLSFQLRHRYSIPFIRLTFECISIDRVFSLQSFEIFGEVVEDENLTNLLSFPKEISVSNLLDFPFKRDKHFGLFHFFKDCSLKARNEIFIISNNTSENRLYSQKLIEWNDEIWMGKWFEVHFISPWKFQICGYRLKSGQEKFLRSWKLIGYEDTGAVKSSKEEILLDEHKNESCLNSLYCEKSFQIQNRKFCDSFLLESDIEFSLSAIEFFGTIKQNE